MCLFYRESRNYSMFSVFLSHETLLTLVTEPIYTHQLTCTPHSPACTRASVCAGHEVKLALFLVNLRCASFTQCVHQCALAHTNTSPRACVHRCAFIDFSLTLCKWREIIRFKKQTQTATSCCFSRTGTQQLSIIYHSSTGEAAWPERKVRTRIFWITAFMQKPSFISE